MNVEVTGQHVEITNALREYVVKKLKRIERHLDATTAAHVVLTMENLSHRAEGTLHVGRGTVHAEAGAADMYAAIDALADKLDRQVLRHKEKMTDHHRAERSLKSM